MYRRRSKLFTALLMLFALRLTSCSNTEDDCKQLCQDTADCPGAAIGNYGGGNCSGACGVLEDLVDRADCEDDYADFLDCSLDAADQCSLEESCTLELLGYYVCITEYCTAKPSARECAGVLCTRGAAGTAPDCSVSSECTGGPRYELSCNDTECSCSTDGAATTTIGYDAAYCSTDNDAALAAAAQACDWQL
jgi:hypothetical protein